MSAGDVTQGAYRDDRGRMHPRNGEGVCRAAAHVRPRPARQVSDVPRFQWHPQPDDVDWGNTGCPSTRARPCTTSSTEGSPSGTGPTSRSQTARRSTGSTTRTGTASSSRRSATRTRACVPEARASGEQDRDDDLDRDLTRGGAPSTSRRARPSTRTPLRPSATRSAARARSASRSARWCPAATSSMCRGGIEPSRPRRGHPI